MRRSRPLLPLRRPLAEHGLFCILGMALLALLLGMHLMWRVDFSNQVRQDIEATASADDSTSPVAPSTRESVIPKKIWTYWDSDSPPEVIRDIIYGWKILNPDHNITLLHPSNIHNHITIPLPYGFDRASPQKQSDWVRLAVLVEQGGFWLDASIILTQPLTYYHDRVRASGNDAFQYYLDMWTDYLAHPIVESWFIVSARNGRYVSAQFREFNLAFANFENGWDYVHHLKQRFGEDMYGELRQGIQLEDYLTIHFCAQKVMVIDGVPPPESEPAEEAPYLLNNRTGWNYDAVVEELFKAEENPPRMIKL
ncbi:hypothetical protein HDU96_000731, partial [Phlyctochytrium bullatum]